MFSRTIIVTSLATLLSGLWYPEIANSGDKFALLVGVSQYKNFRSLKYGESDALALADALRSVDYNVTVMTHRSDENLRPRTAERLQSRIRKLVDDINQATIGPQTTLILAFSGHGLQYKDDPEEGRETYFCPSEGDKSESDTLLKLSFVQDQLNRCKAPNKLLLVDACRNAMTRETQSAAVRPVNPRDLSKSVASETAAFFSCRSKQESFELPELHGGAFITQVTSYVNGYAPDDVYPDNQLELDGLIRFVKRETQRAVRFAEGKVQQPEAVLPSSSAEFNFVFGKRPGNRGPELVLVVDWSRQMSAERNGLSRALESILDNVSPDLLPFVRIQLANTTERAEWPVRLAKAGKLPAEVPAAQSAGTVEVLAETLRREANKKSVVAFLTLAPDWTMPRNRRRQDADLESVLGSGVAEQFAKAVDLHILQVEGTRSKLFDELAGEGYFQLDFLPAELPTGILEAFSQLRTSK